MVSGVQCPGKSTVKVLKFAASTLEACGQCGGQLTNVEWYFERARGWGWGGVGGRCKICCADPFRSLGAGERENLRA
jgi:hypothetical protein